MDLDGDGWKKILEIFPDMDFTQECTDKPELTKYLTGAINANSMGLNNPLEDAACPKLDSDFSKYIVVNGLPICDSEKAKKLIKLLIKIGEKNNIIMKEENIEINYDGEADDKKTTG